ATSCARRRRRRPARRCAPVWRMENSTCEWKAMAKRHLEYHLTHRIGWLRAAVLGANDGVISTASLILGVAAAHASHGAIVTAGLASLVAGAMSMAAGEFVSVSS